MSISNPYATLVVALGSTTVYRATKSRNITIHRDRLVSYAENRKMEAKYTGVTDKFEADAKDAII